MPVRAQLPLPQQEGEEHSQQAQDGEDPHAKMVAGGIGGAGVAIFVGSADEDIEAET